MSHRSRHRVANTLAAITIIVAIVLLFAPLPKEGSRVRGMVSYDDYQFGILQFAEIVVKTPNRSPRFPDGKFHDGSDWRMEFEWSSTSNLVFSLMLLALVVGIVFHSRKIVLHRPHIPHVCAACGYDLRGSPSGICPECGEKKMP